MSPIWTERGAQLSARAAQHLLRLAVDADLRGDVHVARDWLHRALATAEQSGNTDLIARVMVQRSLPIDWLAGDQSVLDLLDRTAQLSLTADASIMIEAIRGMAEMRRPLGDPDGPQFAWTTRASVAQPITEHALQRSVGASPQARATALLAWRSTHRAPRHLTQRQAVTAELLQLAQEEDLPCYLIEAAVYHAVDRAEAGDRDGLDVGLALARWAADRSGNPGVKWRTAALEAGVALLEADDQRAHLHMLEGANHGRHEVSSGWHSADLVINAQRLVDSGDRVVLSSLRPFEDTAVRVNPLAVSIFALCAALDGRSTDAAAFLDESLSRLDEEASMLFMLTRLTHAAVALGERTRLETLVELLEPWSDRVAIDANGWWCDGPIALWAAHAQHLLGRERDARTLVDEADVIATRMGDTRSLRRIAALRESIEEQALSLQYW